MYSVMDLSAGWATCPSPQAVYPWAARARCQRWSGAALTNRRGTASLCGAHQSRRRPAGSVSPRLTQLRPHAPRNGRGLEKEGR